MITRATKNKVDAIWQKMRKGGITNPMFIRQLDKKELKKTLDAEF